MAGRGAPVWAELSFVMAATTYQVTIGERMVRVAVRRDLSAVFVTVDDGPEITAGLHALHGSVYALQLGSEQVEVAARADATGEVRLVMRGLEYTAEVVDEARARLAAVAGVRASSHAHVELKAP